MEIVSVHVHDGPMLCSDDGGMQAFRFLKLGECKLIHVSPVRVSQVSEEK